MKNIILITILFLGTTSSNAQKKDEFRCGLDIAVIPANKGVGIGFAIEPKFNIKQNMNVGLRIGSAAIIKDLNKTTTTVTSGTISAHSYYLGTYDYYFSSSSSFVPFIGGGLGYSSNYNVIVADINNNNSSNAKTQGGLSGLLRTGFEAGKFRFGIEYNMFPKTLLLNESTGVYVNKTSNSFLGINLGFYVGGGKWKNSKTK